MSSSCDVVDAVRSNLIELSSPRSAYLQRRQEIDAAIARVLDGGQFVLGPEVAAFEREFARYVGAKTAIGVASGTDAVELALRGCGIAARDLVFAPAHTAVATIAAIHRAGATCVLVDIDPERYTIDPDALDRAARAFGRPRNGRLAAVVVVHLYGSPADMPSIADVCRRHELILVEDCAQAHGAVIDGRRVGTWGSAAAFSFYPTKNLGALGDGGAVVTNHVLVAEEVRAAREYGWAAHRHVSDIPGVNSRLDELQAAVLRVKLCYLDEDNAARAEAAAIYDDELADAGLVLPATREGLRPVHHLYVVASDRRDSLRERLRLERILTAVHYPTPIHFQPAYKDWACVSGPLHASERAARTVLSLPLYPQIPIADVRATARVIRDWSRSPGLAHR